jgi:hypothetical protein
VIRGKEIKAKGNTRKKFNAVQKKNENLKKRKRKNKCPAVSGGAKSCQTGTKKSRQSGYVFTVISSGGPLRTGKEDIIQGCCLSGSQNM